MRLLIATLLAALLGTCSQTPPLLDQVKQRGELRVVTRNSPTTFYLGADGPDGLEYDLARRFAESLGVNLNMYAPDNFIDVLPAVKESRADFAAAGLTITDQRKQDFWFGTPYLEITPQLVYRYGEGRPQSIRDVMNTEIKVVAGSSHVNALEKLRRRHPGLTWEATNDANSDELLYRVAIRETQYTVADSTEVALNQRYYPEIRAAFDIGTPEPIAWAFQRSDDDSLYRAAVNFIEQLRDSGELDQIIDRHYGHTDRFDYVGTRIFMRHIDTRLPSYRDSFEEAAQASSVDWRLLAAIGYQESHWNPNAVSPTGVRGLMMLTRNTAQQLGVEDRENAEASIIGGARYFNMVKAKFPERIPEPDRTWLALAAYNVGFGHVEDARILTEFSGGNPDRWMDVRERLPWLTQKKWHTKTKHGYARGREPVIYVENIRSYYDILVWMTNRDAGSDANAAAALSP